MHPFYLAINGCHLTLFLLVTKLPVDEIEGKNINATGRQKRNYELRITNYGVVGRDEHLLLSPHNSVIRNGVVA
jgi:hypothetical protein